MLEQTIIIYIVAMYFYVLINDRIVVELLNFVKNVFSISRTFLYYLFYLF